MMTDPIADLLTRVRNAISAGHRSVTVPASKIKVRIAEILKAEGYIDGFETVEQGVQGAVKINLRYDEETGECPIHGLRRVSKPGCRVYSGKDDIPDPLGGLGITILTTPKGLMTGKAARKDNVGGEVICMIW